MKSAVDRVRRAALSLCALALAPIMAQAAPDRPQVGPEADYPVVIGAPYTQEGVGFTPSDTLNYDAVGHARLAPDGAGGGAISGAHHTLPLPCYVEVTALDSGHTILVRLDRRGPDTAKDLIELSPGAWAQLGLAPGMEVTVRVRRVNPPEPERALLRAGQQAPARIDTPPGLLAALKRKLGVAPVAAPEEPPVARPAPAPIPAAKPPVAKPPVIAKPVPAPVPPKPLAPLKPIVAKPDVAKPVVAKPTEPKPAAPKSATAKPAEPKAAKAVVQVAAFASRANADKAAAQVGGRVEAAGKFWRVRIVTGSTDEARSALARARHAGYAGALILHGE